MLHLNRPWRHVGCWKERLRDDWLDRVKGWNGGWVESEEEEAGREIYEDEPLPVDAAGSLSLAL